MTSTSGRTVNDPAFCPVCGDPAGPPAGGWQEQRRTVTVLFIDIVGFTDLTDDLDCEDVRALQKDYFAVVSDVVRASGGVVEKYVGDAVMALFGTHHGAPQLTGEIGRDAAQAVAAGLAVQQALRGRLLAGRFVVSTRTGIATGVAIIDCAEARDGGQAMISGSVVNLAARLQAYAPHDTVVVCAATRRATDELVAYQDLPPVAVAGRPQPLELWRALHPRPAPGHRPDHPATPRVLDRAGC
jgi:class 3 adenylate cyclase